MSGIKVGIEDRDPWHIVRSEGMDTAYTLFNSAPRRRVHVTIPPHDGLQLARGLLWRSLRAIILRRSNVRFWMDIDR